MFEENRFEGVLKSLRVRRGKVWTQARTAKLLEVSLRTYVGWENGESLPFTRSCHASLLNLWLGMAKKMARRRLRMMLAGALIQARAKAMV